MTQEVTKSWLGTGMWCGIIFLLVVSLSFRDLQSTKLHEMLTKTLQRIKRRCGTHEAWISQLPAVPCVPPCTEAIFLGWRCKVELGLEKPLTPYSDSFTLPIHLQPHGLTTSFGVLWNNPTALALMLYPADCKKLQKGCPWHLPHSKTAPQESHMALEHPQPCESHKSSPRDTLSSMSCSAASPVHCRLKGPYQETGKR